MIEKDKAEAGRARSCFGRGPSPGYGVTHTPGVRAGGLIEVTLASTCALLTEDYKFSPHGGWRSHTPRGHPTGSYDRGR